MGVFVAAPVTAGHFDDFFVTGVGRRAPFYSGHVPVSLGVRHIGFDDAGVGGLENHAAAGFPLHLLRALAQIVALEGLIGLDLARTGEREPFLGAGFGLQLGHFA